MKAKAATSFLVALALHGFAIAGEVIAHPTVTLSPDEIRDTFLGEKLLSGDLRLVPVDNQAVQADFLAKILQTDVRKYNARWTKKSFREGISVPAVKSNDEEVIAFVRATPGAIGYIGRSTARENIKVLERY